MVLTNVIWPAVFVNQEIWRFWFLVFGTILIEALIIRYSLKYTSRRSLLISTIGNLISGIIGTFVMLWAMLIWHWLTDWLIPTSAQWILTFIIMCFGSVVIEVIAINLIFHEKIKRIFIPLLIGNLLTYSFILSSMIFNFFDGPKVDRVEVVSYHPSPDQFKMNDTITIHISDGTISVPYDKKGQVIKSQSFLLTIPFSNIDDESRDLSMRSFDISYTIGFGVDSIMEIPIINLHDTLYIITDDGYREPRSIDTIMFVRKTHE